jgi:HK97 family phage prohead protease
MNTERRMTPATGFDIETREDGRQVVAGYAAVFHRADDPGTQYKLGKDLTERIAPTAFNRSLAEKVDTVALFNHDSNMLLGRASAGTLRLSVDARGLRYEIDHNPADPQHVSVLEKLKRGDLTGSSFAFQVKKQSFHRGENGDIRSIEDVELLDVGPVTYPAYKSTTTGVRCDDGDDAERARDAWLKEAEAVQVRTRLVLLDTE